MTSGSHRYLLACSFGIHAAPCAAFALFFSLFLHRATEEEAAAIRVHLVQDKMKKRAGCEKKPKRGGSLWHFFRIIESETKQSFLLDLIGCRVTTPLPSVVESLEGLPLLSQWRPDRYKEEQRPTQLIHARLSPVSPDAYSNTRSTSAGRVIRRGC